MNDDDVWFEPKRFGYGSGLPVAWQGWVLVLAGTAACIIVALIRDLRIMIPLEIIIVTTLLVLSAQHTRGGWHWRWGRRGD